MRRIATNTDSRHVSIPRGWVIVGAALIGWMLFAGLWSGFSAVFGFVTASI